MTLGRILLGSFVALIVLLVLWSWQLMRPGPPIRLSKQTTYITEPLADDGLPDYVAYLDAKYSEGVTPQNNATVLLVRASGLREVRGEDRGEWFARLGMEYVPEEGEYLVSQYDPSTVELTANWIIAYWRSQQDGSDPPTTMDGLSEYSDTIQKADEEFLEENRDYAGEFDDILENWVPPGEEFDWLRSAQEASKALIIQAQSRPWTSQQIPSMAAWLDANDRWLDLVVEASKRPKMHAPMLADEDTEGPRLIAVDIPVLLDSRDLIRALHLRITRNLAEKRFSEARDDIFATHRLARLTGLGPSMVHCLVANAFDHMACQQQFTLAAQPDVSSDVLSASLDELRRLRRWQRVADQIDESERLMALDAALSLRRDPATMGMGGRGDSEVIAHLAASNIDWNIVLERINGYYDDLVASCRNPDDEQSEQKAIANEIELDEKSKMELGRVAGAALSRRARSELITDWLLRLTTPASYAARSVEVRTNVYLDLATTALALALHRARHGAYPDSLDALVPDILEEVPIDLFAEGPFHYERRGDGYLLYSVGDSEEDNRGTDGGGDIVEGEWAETLPATEEEFPDVPMGDDLVVRVPIPPLVIPSLPEDVTLPPLAGDVKPDEEETGPSGDKTDE